MLKKLFLHPLSHPLIILIFGILAYSNSFEGPFVLDDEESIVRNEVIRDLASFAPGGEGYDFFPRRWVGYLTFALNHHFGGLDVTGYHLFNLGIHLATALLIHALVLLTFRTPHLAGSNLAPQARNAALLAALFFVVHPVQTQAVTYVVQRLTSLCTMLYLLSIVLYAAGRLASEERARHAEWKEYLLLAGSVTAAVLAMKTKEIAFTLPLAAALYEISFFRGEWKKRLFLLLPLLATLAIIPYDVVTGGDEAVGESGLRVQTEIPRLHYLFTQFRVIVTYLRLLVLPVNQNLDYQYPVFTSFFAAPVMLSLLLLAAMLGVALYLYGYRKGSVAGAADNAESRLAAFGIFWFFLTISVESSLVPIIDVIFEHRLYLPSVGLAIAAGVLLLQASRKTSALLHGRLPLAAASLAIVALAAATWQRNRVWSDRITLWEDVVRKSPGKVRPLYNLGCYLSDAGRVQEAMQALSQTVRLDPKHADAWHNLGRTYLLEGRNEEAVQPLRTAVQLSPDLHNAILNLAVALNRTGRYNEAITLLENERRRNPQWPELHLNLGLAYIGAGNISGARSELFTLYQLNPQLARLLAQDMERLQNAGRR